MIPPVWGYYNGVGWKVNKERGGGTELDETFGGGVKKIPPPEKIFLDETWLSGKKFSWKSYFYWLQGWSPFQAINLIKNILNHETKQSWIW